MCNCTNTRQYKYCQLLLWLTVNLPNLCIYVYIYQYVPPLAHARPHHGAGHLPNICLSASANASICCVSWGFAWLDDAFLCRHAIWCQLLCYQSPFSTMFEAWDMENRPCCRGGAYPLPPMVKSSPMLDYIWSSQPRTHTRVLHTSFRITCYSCNRAWNGKRRGWRDVRLPVTESQPLIPLTFYMLYRENISPFRVREILFSYV